MAISQDQVNQALSDFDRLLADASVTREQVGLGDNNRPQMQPGGDAVAHLQAEQQFNQSLARFNSNPLRPVVQQLREARARDIAGGLSEADADRLHQARIGQVRQVFARGVQEDRIHEEAKQQRQQEMMQAFASGQMLAGVIALFRMLFPDAEKLPGELLQQKLDGQNLDPAAKSAQIARISNLSSGLKEIGLNLADPNVQNMVAGAIMPSAQPTQQQQGTQVASNAPPAAPFNATNGTMPGAPVNTPAAPRQQVASASLT